MIERLTSTLEADAETARRRLDFQRRELKFGAERDEIRRRWNLLGNVRLAAFVVAAMLAGAAIRYASVPLIAVAAAAVVTFVYLIVRHRRLRRELNRATALTEINREAQLRADRAWYKLPHRDDQSAPSGHAYADDLDLFGPASLLRLLGTVETPLGLERLTQWLLFPPSVEQTLEHQRAVVSLAPELEWRQRFEVHGRLIGSPQVDFSALLEWCESEPWLAGRSGIRMLAIAGPVLLLLSAAGALLGLPAFVVVIFAGLNLLISQGLAAEARKRIEVIADQHHAISQFAGLLREIESMPGDAPMLQSKRSKLQLDGVTASSLLAALDCRAAFAVPPSTLVYYPLQAIFAWDVNVLSRLESWQQQAGRNVREWLGSLGEVEAIAALAGLAYEQPSWTMPVIDASTTSVVAKSLGHPLLADAERVTNDLEVGPPGSFLLVTGSNMSGKSTLLRAIGVNVVLANAGGPVCASEMSLPAVRLWTSVRVEDSLERGVSFFMAELRRLKEVVDAATEPDPEGRRLLYLLDEVLQGTNTAERQVAARRVIRYLVDYGALGAVSTHDLTLAEGPELSTIARAVHLRDTVTATGMSFDYKLRDGIATSTNALRLMDIVFGPQSSGSLAASD